MGVYVVKRLLLIIPLLFIISFLTFVLINLSPEDPAKLVLQAQDVPVITDELIAQTRQELGLNNPFIVQYINWLASCLQLDFGDSYVKHETVWMLLGPAFFNTLKLTLVSSMVIIVSSIMLGTVCALTEGRLLDRFIRGTFFFLSALPAYLIGIVMIWYFSVTLDLFPTSGLESYQSYILPVSVIAFTHIGLYFRTVRSAMLANLNEDYVLYARASGLSEKKIIATVLKNSLQVSISIFCMSIPLILGGTVVIENVFAWPGLGSLSIKSILSRDFPVIQAYVLIIAVAFVVFNTISDIVNTALNPKLRIGE
ncbi:ABC transporter permease [Priestia flexa]|jgi:nickel transport system permease protein|uniref:ABC transporter permease n=1 Tax=Priestia flexa TaxID=86664 RepID=A0A8I1MHJ5_9BACI|nr:nickel/cobalt ABC transporter permease [Priestia flexa]MBN8253275.1 ABC transporter permease [Priestia flexa]MBN8435699.1 ABC transporter permease [Priestia flexa]MCA0968255.1 ABC transporter permease [Priestia flexa]UIR31400.1 ABC transporter permease [Priestia flexa]